MTTYLAGPIAGCTDEEVHGWRDRVTLKLKGETLDPSRRDYRFTEITTSLASFLVDQDKDDIDSCGALLAYCPYPSVGTSMEIFYAYSTNKLVIVVVPEGVPVSPWLVAHSHAVCRDFYDALSRLA